MAAEPTSAHGTPRHCLALFYGVILLAIGVAILCIGPSVVLRYFLMQLPDKPGWMWFWGHCIVTSLSIVILMPIWPPMCMASGLLFGLGGGTVLNFIAIVSAACISILLGRTFFRASIRSTISSYDMPWLRRWMRTLERDERSWLFQVLFRFLLIPMFIRNYAPSVLNVPFWKLLLASLPHSAWVGFLFASLGKAFKDPAEIVKEGNSIELSHFKWQHIMLPVVSFLLTGILCWLLFRTLDPKGSDSEDEPIAGNSDGLKQGA